MGKAADAIFAAVAELGDDTQHIEVEEWGGAKVYFSPLTAGDVDTIARKHKGFPEEWSFAAMVDLIVLKARDEDGEKMFTLEHKPNLRRMKAKVISKVAGAIMAGRGMEEIEGN